MLSETPNPKSQIEIEIDKLETFIGDQKKIRNLMYTIASYIRRYTHPEELDDECKDIISDSYEAVYMYIMKNGKDPTKRIDCMPAFITKVAIRFSLQLVNSLKSWQDVKRDFVNSPYFTNTYYKEIWESEQELSDLMKLCFRRCDDLSQDHKDVLEYMMMGYVSNIIIAEELGLSPSIVRGLKQTIRRRIKDIGDAFNNTK